MPYTNQSPLPGGITWDDYYPTDPPSTPPKRAGIGWGEILGALGSIAETTRNFFWF